MGLVLVLGFIFTLIYLINKYLFSYWTRLNIPQADNPSLLFGNSRELFTRQQTFLHFFEDLYKKYKNHRFIGIYMLYKPILLVNDPKLVQNILINDFKVFHDRPMPHESAEFYPLMANLFNMQGKKWRDLRVRLSPAFTASRLKTMVPVQKASIQYLNDYMTKQIKTNSNKFDFKEVLARYTLSTLSSIGFGIDNDCLNEPDNIFRRISLMVFELSMRSGILNFLMIFAPDLFTALRLDPFPAEVSPFMFSMVNQTIEFREKNNFQRNDFMDLMIKLKNVGYLPADKDDDEDMDEWTRSQTDVEKVQKMTMDEVAAQAFVFTIGGFENITTLMHLCIFELARHPECQQKLYEEINKCLHDSDDVTYEILSEMKFLDCCINETLRLYPLAGLLNRIAGQDYKIPDSNVTIPKNTFVFIPTIGLQRDAEFYDNPLEFIPERFENSQNGKSKVEAGITYVPFGDGPRHCIGMRLARTQVKYAMANLIKRYTFELDDKSLQYGELKFDPKYMTLNTIKPIILKIDERK